MRRVSTGLTGAALLALLLLAGAGPARPQQSTPDAAAPAPADAPGEAAAAAAPAPAGTPASLSVSGRSETEAALAAEQAALSDIEASITLSKERADALRGEIDAMKGDRAQQNAALIAAAQRVKLAEIEVQDTEERLGTLIATELEVRGRLNGADGSISNVLAALERISRNPPPALIVDPSDALGSARSAILISAILPQLKTQADLVNEDLKKLVNIKAAALEEEAKIKANLTILEEEQLRIATLIAAKKRGEEKMTADLAAEEAAAAALAGKATSLRQLVDELSRRARALATAADASAAAQAGGNAKKLDPDTIRLALANTERTAPAVPFEAMHGFLALPASGVTVMDYGAGDGFGGISNGVSLVTRADAQVVAPADGTVLYRGDYLNYGQIVILNAGQDYTILLAGLADVSVDIGQFVLRGEPLGVMGSRTIGRTVVTSAGVSRPTLYIELRRQSEPVDPTGWWAPPADMIESG